MNQLYLHILANKLFNNEQLSVWGILKALVHLHLFTFEHAYNWCPAVLWTGLRNSFFTSAALQSTENYGTDFYILFWHPNKNTGFVLYIWKSEIGNQLNSDVYSNRDTQCQMAANNSLYAVYADLKICLG